MTEIDRNLVLIIEQVILLYISVMVGFFFFFKFKNDWNRQEWLQVQKMIEIWQGFCMGEYKDFGSEGVLL